MPFRVQSPETSMWLPRGLCICFSRELAPCLGLLPFPISPTGSYRATLGPVTATEPVTMGLRLRDLAPLPMGMARLLHGAVTSMQGTPQPEM